MAASRRRRLGIAAVLVGAFVACDVAIGLNDYTIVPCAFDCGAADTEAGADAADQWAGDGADSDAGAADSDAPTDKDAAHGDGAQDADADVADAEADAADADADAADGETGPPAPPSLTQLWAHWPMPNPDASIAPDSSTLLPNQMAYDATDATVGDLVTKLTWQRVGTPSPVNYASAQTICPQGWRLPTRIELVSLIDFTQQGGVVIDPTVFPTQGGKYWTSSIVAPDAGTHWTVDFGTGFVDWLVDTQQGYCRCVQGGS